MDCNRLLQKSAHIRSYENFTCVLEWQSVILKIELYVFPSYVQQLSDMETLDLIHSFSESYTY